MGCDNVLPDSTATIRRINPNINSRIAKLMNQHLKLCLAAFTCIVFTGCNSNPVRQLSEVASNLANYGVFSALDKHDKEAATARENYIKYRDVVEKYQQEYITRVQPRNKKEECKLWFRVDVPSDAKVFWDGACKDGYAFGLGREFLIWKSGGNILDLEEISYYMGGPQRPVHLAAFDHVKNNYKLHAYGDAELGNISYQLLNSQSGTSIATLVNNLKYIRTTGYIYRTLSETKFDEDIRGSRVVLGQEDLEFKYIKFYNAPLTMVTHDGTYTMRRFVDDRVSHQDAAGKEVVLPETYIERVSTIYKKINTAAAEVLSMTAKSQKMVDYYKKETCKESVKVDFISNDKYKLICGSDGYFASYMPAVKKTREETIAKRIADYERWVSRREKVKADLYRRQMVEAAQRQAKAAEHRNLQSSLQDINDSIRATNQSLTSSINSAQNSMQMYSPPKANAPTYYHRNGNSIVGSDGTSCSRIGNAVVCN
jgi:hypothetical protein